MMRKFVLSFVAMAGLVLVGQSSFAAEQWARWLTPEINKFHVLGNFEATYLKEAKTDEGEDRFSAVELNMPELTVPIIQTDKTEWEFNLSGDSMNIDTEAVMPDSDVALPDELASLVGGTTVRHIMDNGWLVGISGRFGSASDKLFESEDELVYGGTAFIKIPHGEYNAFIAYVDYSNNRFDSKYNQYPMGGVGYQLVLAENAWTVLGFPATFVHYEPIKNLTFDASYIFPRVFNAKLAYAMMENRLSVYSQFKWDYKRYLRSGRVDEDDGLIFYDKRVSLGADFQITENIGVGAAVGYVFDRFIFEGQEYAERHVDRIDIDNTWFASASLDIKF